MEVPRLLFIVIPHIVGCWRSSRKHVPFLVSYEYLRRVMSTLTPELSSSDRRSLGRTLSTFLALEDLVVDVSCATINMKLGSNISIDTMLFINFFSNGRFFKACQMLSKGMTFLVSPELAGE